MDINLSNHLNRKRCNSCVPCWAFDEGFFPEEPLPGMWVISGGASQDPSMGFPQHICEIKTLNDYSTYYLGVFDVTANEWFKVEPPKAPHLVATTPVGLAVPPYQIDTSHIYEQRFKMVDKCGATFDLNSVIWAGIAARCVNSYGVFFAQSQGGNGVFMSDTRYDELAIDNTPPSSICTTDRKNFFEVKVFDSVGTLIDTVIVGGYAVDNTGATYQTFLNDLNTILTNNGINATFSLHDTFPINVGGYKLITSSNFGLTFKHGYLSSDCVTPIWNPNAKWAIKVDSSSILDSVTSSGDLNDINAIGWDWISGFGAGIPC